MMNNIKFEKLVCYIILTYLIISQTNLNTLLPESHNAFLSYNKHAQQMIVILIVLLMTNFSLRYTTLILIILLLFSTNSKSKPNKLLQESNKPKNPDELIDELYDYYHDKEYQPYNEKKKLATKKSKLLLDTFYESHGNQNLHQPTTSVNDEVIDEMKRIINNNQNATHDTRYELLKNFK